MDELEVCVQLEKQIELEKEMTNIGIEKYRILIEKASKGGTLSNCKTGKKLISLILNEYQSAIKDYIGRYEGGKAVKGLLPKGYKLLSLINDSEQVAYIAAKAIINSLGLYRTESNGRDLTLSFVAISVGGFLEDQYRFNAFKEHNKAYYNAVRKNLNSKSANYEYQRKVLVHSFNKLECTTESWTVSEKAHLGLRLVDLFLTSTGLITIEKISTKIKKGIYTQLDYIKPTEELLQWLNEEDNKMELLSPFYLPMVIEPKDWTNVFNGGYISPYIRKNKFVKNNSREYQKRLNDIEMPMVYNAVNNIQRTAWKINTNVLRVAEALWKNNSIVAGFPDRENKTPRPCPIPKDVDKDTLNEAEMSMFKSWKREAVQVYRENIRLRSLRLLTTQLLHIANKFQDEAAIFFPHQLDFRGRVYPIPILLNPQGNDLSRGLLTFSKGKSLNNETAVNWLRIHGANTFGNDKMNFEGRIAFIKGIEKEIIKYTEAPLENLGWSLADKPMQFLAFCFDYVGYLNKGYSYVSSIPLSLDGTCNGLQHYSALLKDLDGAKAVNLYPSSIPNDIYSIVAETLREKLYAIIYSSHSSSLLVSNDVLDPISCSKQWVSLNINRKLTKRPVMTLPYGATLLSCRKYVEEYLLDNYSMSYLHTHFEGIAEAPQDTIFKVSNFLAKYLWEAIGEVLISAVKGMDFFRSISKAACIELKPLIWQLPTGFLVHQEYENFKSLQIKTEMFGKCKRMVLQAPAGGIDKHRQHNGVCPNIIHSLDSAALMKYIDLATDNGIWSFSCIHDSYGTLAADTEMSSKLIRESFVWLYSYNIPELLLSSIASNMESDKLIKKLPSIPKMGTFDIKDVLKSEYFFS